MNIFIFEYITGGGFIDQTVPPSLLSEGRMMLQAVLDELALLPNIKITVPLEPRCQAGLRLPANASKIDIVTGSDVIQQLPEMLADCDIFWPIAPEMQGILSSIAGISSQLRCRTWLSDVDAVAVCSDKYLSYQQLQQHGLPVIETQLLNHQLTAETIVVKPRDGVGCQDSQVLSCTALQNWRDSLNQANNYIQQPYTIGQSSSLSALFAKGQGWLLSCNQQQIALNQTAFTLSGCYVNIDHKNKSEKQWLVDAIAQAIPGLWGYIGIDFIDTVEQGPLLLEINPRLTTSYVGIRPATGINVAEQLLRLHCGEQPALNHQNERSVEILIA